MTATADIATDLLTPLGAYLRLREREGVRGTFLLESVERGRLGRYSFVGCGTRLVSFDEAEALDEPVVGYLSYDHIAKLEPTVPLPEAGPAGAESRFIVADTIIRFDHGGGMAEVLCGDPAELHERLAVPHLELPEGAGKRGPTRRMPSRFEYERAVRRAKDFIRAGDCFQVVLSQRAERPTTAS